MQTPYVIANYADRNCVIVRIDANDEFAIEHATDCGLNLDQRKNCIDAIMTVKAAREFIQYCE